MNVGLARLQDALRELWLVLSIRPHLHIHLSIITDQWIPMLKKVLAQASDAMSRLSCCRAPMHGLLSCCEYPSPGRRDVTAKGTAHM